MPRPNLPVGRRAVLTAGIFAVGGGLAACTDTPTPSPAAGGPTGSAAPSTTPTTSATAATAPATPTASVPSATTSAPSASAPAVLSSPGPDLRTGSAAYPAVALTFHGAGDLALTTAVLDIARTAGAHLTVFAVGQWLAANPGIGRAIVAAGHDLGNHTWSHQPMTSLDAAAARSEISQGAEAVAGSVGQAGLLFRPSGTPTSTATIRTAAAASGYARCIGYDVDPLDYDDPGAALVRSRTLAAVKAGSIVSLHLGHQGTVDALPGILQGLAAKGLQAVTVSRLLAGAA
ncbi:MAG: polysaccharide deacetylase family protein [Lapillicoccus sp.]